MTGEPADHPLASPFLWTPGVAARETLLFLDGNGVDAGPILGRAGISRGELLQQDARVGVVAQYRFLEDAAAAARDSLLGLHVAQQMDVRNGGVPFYLATSSPTIAEGLHNLARYSRVASEAILFELVSKGGNATLTFVPVRRYSEPRQQYSEFVAMLVVRVLRTVTNYKFAASLATFAHTRATLVEEAARLLGCPVAFAHAEESVVFPGSALELAVVSSDTRLLEILKAHADHLLAERRTATALPNIVERELTRLLPVGRAHATVVAEKLGMSTRSFARHLAEEHTTFSDILDNLRKQLAQRYLDDDRIPLQQIAWLLGYSETAAFGHAFKRWTGTSPGRARQRPIRAASR